LHKPGENRQPSTNSSSWFWLAVLFLVALVSRIGWLHFHQFVLNADGAEYARCAENLLRGRFDGIWSRPEVIFPPLYPILIAAASFFTRDIEAAARTVSTLCGALLVIPVFYLVRRLYGQRVAVIATSIVALHPILLAISSSTFSESTYLFLLACSLYWTFECLWERRWWYGGVAGACWGLAYLVRPEAFLFDGALVFALVVAGAYFKTQRIAWWKSAALAALTFAVVAAPYVFFLHSKTGQFRLEGKSNYNYVLSRRLQEGKGLAETTYGIDNDLNMVGPGLDPVRYVTYSPYPRHLSDTLHMVMRNARVHITDLNEVLFSIHSYGSPVVVLLVSLGLFGEPWKRDRLWRELFCIGLAGMLFVVLLSVEWFMIRLALPLLLLLLIWAAKGIDQAASWATGSWQTLTAQPAPPAAVAVAVRLLLVIGLLGVAGAGVLKEDPFAEENQKNLPQKEAGLWLKSRGPKPADGDRLRILSTVDIVPFYSGGVFLSLPHATSETALRYIAKQAPDLVVLDNDTRPYLRDWRSNGVPDPQAHLIYRTGHGASEVIVYQWQGTSGSHAATR
jgi:4-amino-4-deoxy-L-arabinose transferase-like glycosyltransferase